MPTPYEFGYSLGANTAKTASEKIARGLVADALLYSNPYTGIPTGVYDTARNLYHGQYLGALGSATSAGLSLIGGNFLSSMAGGVGKTVGRGLQNAGWSIARAGANNAAQAGVRGAVGRAAFQTGKAMVAAPSVVAKATAPAVNAMTGVNKAVARGVQRVVPAKPLAHWTKNPVRALVNDTVKNPLMTVAGYHTSNPAPRPAARPVQA